MNMKMELAPLTHVAGWWTSFFVSGEGIGCVFAAVADKLIESLRGLPDELRDDESAQLVQQINELCRDASPVLVENSAAINRRMLRWLQERRSHLDAAGAAILERAEELMQRSQGN
jgi:hypothetical protein